jgi:hypothetical protein
MEVIRNSSLLKEAQLDYYKRYSEHVNVKCPFCANKTPRTRTYHSLKSLTWHVANEHDSDSGYPFSFEQIEEVVRALALAKEWRILR